MKDALGSSLRELWKEKGNPQCSHPELNLERSFAGVTTGAYLCTTCGAILTTSAPLPKSGTQPKD